MSQNVVNYPAGQVRLNDSKQLKRAVAPTKSAVLPDEKSLVRSLAKGFKVLEAFDAHQTTMTLSQIAQKTDLDAAPRSG